MTALQEEAARLMDGILNDMEDIDAKLQVLAVNLERLGGEKVEAVAAFHSQWQAFVRAVHLAGTLDKSSIGDGSSHATDAAPAHQTQAAPSDSQQAST